MRRRRGSRHGAARFLALALLLAGGPALAGKSLTISAGLIPWKAIGGPGNLALRECYEEYLRTHSGLELAEYRSVRLPGVHRGAAQVMSLAAAAGPDISLIPFAFLANYAREGLIQPVDDLFDAWPERGRWPDPVVDDLKINGRSWGSVLTPSYGMLLGNPKVFKDQGLSEQSMPKTWEEFARLVPVLSRQSNCCGFAMLRERTLGYLWLALAREAGGGNVVRLTGTGIEVDFDADASRRATESIGEIGKLARSNPSSSVLVFDKEDDLLGACRSDRVALVIMNSESRAIFGSGVYMGPVPGAVGPEPLAYADGGSIFVLPSYIRDPYLRNAIWAFQTSDVWNGKKVDMLELGLAVKGRSSDIRPILGVWYPDHPAAAQIPPTWREAMAKVWSRARPMPPDLEFEEFNAIMSTRLTDLFMQGGDPGAVLRDARAAFDSKVHQWERRKMLRWRILGWGVLAALGILLVFSLVRLALTLGAELRVARPAPGAALSPGSLGFVLALFAPAVVLSVAFGVVPLLDGLRISLSSHVLRGGGELTGLSNYFDVVINPLTQLVVRNTLHYLLLSFLLGFVAPLVLALVLSDFPVCRGLVCTWFLLPAVSSAVVLAVLWQQTYQGSFNVFVRLLGLSPRDWLKDPAVAMFAVVLPQAWANLGVGGLIYLAGLSTIPNALYEEAEMAGAGLYDRLRAVTIPHLAPLIGVSLVGWLISAMRTAEHVFLMTGGGPEKATYVVGLDIFTQAYVSIRFGYAMAEVWLLVAVVLLLATYQVRAVHAGHLRLERG